MNSLFSGKTRYEATFVESPRAGDAIGVALRGAYVRDECVPAELADLIAQLNRTENRRTAALK
jgi:hypothetical protein